MKTAAVILKFFLLISMVVLPILLMAQPPDFTDDTDDVPFDGGVCLLVAAGIAYGIKKGQEYRKPKKA